jgi:hypothetical protein
LRACSHRARNAHTTNPTADPREHPAKFTLDSWLMGGPTKLTLRTLNCLRKRRYATLSINFLNAQETSLLLHLLGFF